MRCTAMPESYRGGLPGYRLNRVLEYIGDNLAEDLSLSRLAEIVGMSPHYFAELFRKSTGYPPHRYVLLQRIERAKRGLNDRSRSVIEVGLDAGFQNASHFARIFRHLVGISPSRFRSEMQSSHPYEVVPSVRRAGSPVCDPPASGGAEHDTIVLAQDPSRAAHRSLLHS
jgi:AraC family transcriptional regulator